MKTIQTLILCLLTLVGTAAASAQSTYYAQGVAHCILDDGSGTFPISEAGEVFVGTTPDEAPAWTAGSCASTTVSGPFSTSGSTVSFYFWARAKAGYTFVGWGSTKTSKTATSGTADLEGKSWVSKTTLWSAGSAAAPKQFVRYAIFRKNAAEDTTGGGVAMSSIENDVHTQGSTIEPWPVKIIYSEPLAYKDITGYSEGYGVNTGLIAAITCTGADTEVKATGAKISGAAINMGADAYGLVYFPALMPVGTYAVHVPKGLFQTASGGVTAAVDFTVTITPDDTPFTVTSTSPTEKYAWDSSEATQTKETDGNFSTITVTFNKNIARVDAEGKDIVLLNTTTGRVSKPSICSVSATTNKRLGVIAFDTQPDGDYTFTLPADVFFDASGHGNTPLTLTFSIKGSKLDAWELPTYSSFVTSPANNSTVDELDEVTIAFSRQGYEQPRQLYLNNAVTAAKVKEIYKEGANYNDPDVLPEMQSTDIEGVTLAFEDGLLKVRFAQPVKEETKVVVGIPAKAVININSRPGASLQTIYEHGGCTNASIQITLSVKPSTLTAIDALEDAAPRDGKTIIVTPDGKHVSRLQPGVNIVRTIGADGTISVRKVVKQ